MTQTNTTPATPAAAPAPVTTSATKPAVAPVQADKPKGESNK